MKYALVVAGIISSTAMACGGTAGSSSDDNAAPEEESTPAGSFDPPPAPDGYTRIVAPIIHDIPPGDDVMYCQLVYGAQDRDLDILDVQGFQSRSSHHAVAYATTKDLPVGWSGPCASDDSMAGTYLGGIGGEAGGGMEMPEGVAFRLPRGNGILVNAHFVNATTDPMDGETVLDVKFAEVDPSRKILSLFANANLSFNIPQGGSGESATECVFPRDMEFLLFSNHMHHYGTSAVTQVVRTGGAVDLVHEDPVWTDDMEFKADMTQWELTAPLLVHQGDTLRTSCSWTNETDQDLAFPAEMCVGFGFFLSDGTSSPLCLNGAWQEQAPATP